MRRNHGLKICQSCNKEFQASQHNQKYCGSQTISGTCAFNEKRKITKIYQKSHHNPLRATCLKCSKEFTPYNKRQVLCGSRKNKFGCSYIGNKKYKKDNRRRGTLKKYGLTIKDYEDILLAQDGVCAICKKPPEKKKLCVDHDHLSGLVRGLLCHGCNTGIGHFMESTPNLFSAIEYLKKYGK